MWAKYRCSMFNYKATNYVFLTYNYIINTFRHTLLPYSAYLVHLFFYKHLVEQKNICTTTEMRRTDPLTLAENIKRNKRHLFTLIPHLMCSKKSGLNFVFEVCSRSPNCSATASKEVLDGFI